MPRIFTVVCLTLFTAAPAIAGLSEGVAALRIGDYATALVELRPAAEHGSAEAQLYMGALYENGRGVAVDYAEAAKWYRMAADQNQAAAQFSIGLLYAKGRGVVQDDTVAADWLRKAAEQGLASAEYDLSIMYTNGKGVARDDVQALAWAQKLQSKTSRVRSISSAKRIGRDAASRNRTGQLPNGFARPSTGAMVPRNTALACCI